MRIGILKYVLSKYMVRKDVIYGRHKILKDKKNKWSIMAGTINNTFVTEIILKLLKLNHYMEIQFDR